MTAKLKKIRKRPFNNTQIKDGWVVRVNKDGSIRSRIAPYVVKHDQSHQRSA